MQHKIEVIEEIKMVVKNGLEKSINFALIAFSKMQKNGQKKKIVITRITGIKERIVFPRTFFNPLKANKAPSL